MKNARMQVHNAEHLSARLRWRSELIVFTRRVGVISERLTPKDAR